MISNTFDTSLNFFEIYPELKPTLKNLNSMQAWACLLYVHPGSAFSQLEFKDKVEIFRADYDKDFDPTLANYAAAIDLLTKLILSKKQKFLIDWEMKLEERANFIASLSYTADTFELLDKMMSASSKMWEQYLKCLKDVEAEQGITMGGAQESLSEKGLI